MTTHNKPDSAMPIFDRVEVTPEKYNALRMDLVGANASIAQLNTLVDALKKKLETARNDAIENCKLTAHHTGDGWSLAVEDRHGNVIAYLEWPESWPGIVDSNFLARSGFEIV
jgi:hypothetical protein